MRATLTETSTGSQSSTASRTGRSVTRAANVLDGHACFGLLKETDDLLISESHLLHVRHSPEVDELCAIQLVWPKGGRSRNPADGLCLDLGQFFMVDSQVAVQLIVH